MPKKTHKESREPKTCPDCGRKKSLIAKKSLMKGDKGKILTKCLSCKKKRIRNAL